MQEYRAYIIGEDGHIQFRIDLLCRDEADARERASALADGHDIELWQGDHVIACIGPAREAAAIGGLSRANSPNKKVRA